MEIYTQQWITNDDDAKEEAEKEEDDLEDEETEEEEDDLEEEEGEEKDSAY